VFYATEHGVRRQLTWRKNQSRGITSIMIRYLSCEDECGYWDANELEETYRRMEQVCLLKVVSLRSIGTNSRSQVCHVVPLTKLTRRSDRIYVIKLHARLRLRRTLGLLHEGGEYIVRKRYLG
jgi:hypothetical protein